MKTNSSGKVLTIFLIIITILSVSSTAIAVFIFQKEKEQRIAAEKSLDKKHDELIRLKTELRDVRRENFLLEEKNKEADEKINNLLDELELEKGLKEEMKRESQTFKKQVKELKAEKEQLKAKLKAQKTAIEQLQAQVAEGKDRAKTIERLKALNKDLKEQVEALNKKVEALSSQKNALRQGPTGEEVADEKEGPPAEKAPRPSDSSSQEAPVDKKAPGEQGSDAPGGKAAVKETGARAVELQPIVVVEKKNDSSEEMAVQGGGPGAEPAGRVLTVDRETEFVVINLGEKDGVHKGQILSVYRQNDYLGDVKVTRVQPKMSAADLIPPFSSRIVQKDDQVFFK